MQFLVKRPTPPAPESEDRLLCGKRDVPGQGRRDSRAEKREAALLRWLTPIVLAIGRVLFLDVDAAAAPVAEESSLYISLRDIYNETKQRNNSQRQCWD